MIHASIGDAPFSGRSRKTYLEHPAPASNSLAGKTDFVSRNCDSTASPPSCVVRPLFFRTERVRIPTRARTRAHGITDGRQSWLPAIIQTRVRAFLTHARAPVKTATWPDDLYFHRECFRSVLEQCAHLARRSAIIVSESMYE